MVILAFVFLHVCMCVYVYMNVWTNLKGVGERKYACDVRILCINYSKYACDVFPYGNTRSVICKSLTWQTLHSVLSALHVHFKSRMFKTWQKNRWVIAKK